MIERSGKVLEKSTNVAQRSAKGAKRSTNVKNELVKVTNKSGIAKSTKKRSTMLVKVKKWLSIMKNKSVKALEGPI